MNIILFGPPGIGKSTVIGILKTLGERAIDLEDFYPSNIRFKIPSMVDNTYLGGADLNPKRSYHNAIKVLLTTDQETYDVRRSFRDLEHPGKKSQKIHLIKDWEKDDHLTYNITLETTEWDEYETAEVLREVVKRFIEEYPEFDGGSEENAL